MANCRDVVGGVYCGVVDGGCGSVVVGVGAVLWVSKLVDIHGVSILNTSNIYRVFPAWKNFRS